MKKELCAAVREHLTWLTPEKMSEAEFLRFANLFDVEPEDAYAFYWKVRFWEKRQGLVTFKVPA